MMGYSDMGALAHSAELASGMKLTRVNESDIVAEETREVRQLARFREQLAGGPSLPFLESPDSPRSGVLSPRSGPYSPRSTSPGSPRSGRAHRAQAQPATRSPRHAIPRADLDPRDVEPRSPTYLVPGRRDRLARSVSPYPQTHRDSFLPPSKLRDAEMSDHFDAKYSNIEARELDAERRARSTSREWRTATAGLARRFATDSPSSNSPRFKRYYDSQSPSRDGGGATKPWADARMACKRLGKKDWAHAANKMLVSLLQELDVECSTHQEEWTRDRDYLTERVASYQTQLISVQKVLYRCQGKEYEKSRVFWKRLVMTSWSRVIFEVEFKRRMRTAVTVAFWRQCTLNKQVDENGDMVVEPVIQSWAEKIFYTWKVMRLRRRKRELLTDVLKPTYCAIPSSGSPNVPEQVTPTIYRVEGATGRAIDCNGEYENIGSVNGRLMYENQQGAVIYWKWKWKIKGPPSGEEMRYIYSMPGTQFAPPVGQWTLQGFAGPADEDDPADDMPSAPVTVSVPDEIDPEGAAGLARVTQFYDEYKDIIEEIPRQGLMQVRQGNYLLMRAILLGWRTVQVFEDYQNKELGNCVAVSGNSVDIRRNFMIALLKRANIRISRTQFTDGIRMMRIKGMMVRFFSAWRAHHLHHFQSREAVVVGASVRGAIAMKGICFQSWAKSTWEYRVEVKVREKLDALDETMIKQKEIWSLRIAELKGALQQAKRAKEAPEDQQAKSQYALRKKQFGAPAPAFFRTPRMSMDHLQASMPRVSRFG